MKLAVSLALAAAFALTLGAQQSDEIHTTGGPWRLPPTLITANTNLVEVDVVVRDRSGAPIPGLTSRDFRILDNGKPQTVSAFEAVTAPLPPHIPYGKDHAVASASTPASLPAAAASAPRYIALFIDDVNTDHKDLGEAQHAALRFVREALGPGDRVALYTVSNNDNLVYTSDRALLESAIGKIAPHPRSSRSSFSVCPWVTGYESYLIAVQHDAAAIEAIRQETYACLGTKPTPGTVLSGGLQAQWNSEESILATAEATWDLTKANAQNTLAAAERVIDELGQQPGKRIMLMASGGFLSPTLGGQQDAMIQRALRDDVVINALDAKGLYTEEPGRPLDDYTSTIRLPTFTYIFDETSKYPEFQMQEAAMANLAASTGGLFFQNNNDLTLGFERLGLAPEAAYHLAFSPAPLVADGKLHHLTVELTRPLAHTEMQFRRGYFAPQPATAAATLEQRLDGAMRARGNDPALAAHFAIADGAGRVHLDAHFDLAKLALPESDGRFRQRVVLAMGLFDGQGNFVAGRRGELDLALTPGTKKRMDTEGLGARLSLATAPGTYRLRVVVAEAGDAKMAAFSQPITVR